MTFPLACRSPAGRLPESGPAGPMADFDSSQQYVWPAVKQTRTYAGPTDATTLNSDTPFDTSGFPNPTAGTFGWSLDPAGQALSLTYTPSAVPEPGTLALAGLGAAGLACWRRRGQSTSRRHRGSA